VSYVGFPVPMCMRHLLERLVRAHFERNASSATIEFSGKEQDDLVERTLFVNTVNNVDSEWRRCKYYALYEWLL
jgi:hypothetical protein